MASTELQVATEDVLQVTAELRRDFEGTCVAIARELEACDDPSHWLDLLRVLVQRRSEHVGLSTELAERLDLDFLPQVVQLLLGKSFEFNAVENVNKFLQWTLTTVKTCLERPDISRLSCLARILDAHRRFYLHHGTKNDSSGRNQGEENQQTSEILQFTVRDSSDYTSRYFLRNLEFWGKVGGFSVLLDVLQAGASFEALQCILRTLYDVKDHLNPEFLVVYFPKLIDAVCTLIRNLQSVDFYALSRDSLLEVVQVMELLLVKIQHDVDVSDAVLKEGKVSEDLLAREICEQRVQLLRLEISLRFFQSSSLEKRIYGLTEIVVIITRLYNDQIQEQAEPTATSLYAKLSYLVDWMHAKQLMQELLGEKMHVELVKRSTSLFQFASELEVLPTAWIDLVWNCYHADSESSSDEEESRPVQRRHEAFRTTIHDLLLEMVTFMEFPSLIHLVRRIEAVKAKLDSNQLGLLAAIAARRLLVDVPSELPEDRNASSSFTEPPQRSLRQRILMHLWLVVLPSAKSDDLRDEVLLRMHEMLRLEAADDDTGEETQANRCNKECAMVDELLGLCLDNISQRENLAMSLKLFTQLSSLVAEVGIVIADPRNKSYVQILLSETVEFKQGIRQVLQPSEWLQLDDNERAKLPILKDHVSEIKNRLLALRAAWILDECGVDRKSSFTEVQLNNLWELMIVDAFLEDEAALCFQWIELCMNTPLQTRTNKPEDENTDSPRALMALSIAEYLLTTKFSTLPGDCITLSTLCCFHSIFRRINILNGGLEIFTAVARDSSRISSPTARTCSVSSLDGEKEESVELMTGRPLVGLEELWQLAVRAIDSAVAEEIITLLASFHLAFAPKVRQTDLPFQCKMRFLEKCMEFIAAAKTDAEMVETHTLSPATDQTDERKVATDVAVVNRCVDLLRYFLEACKVGDSSAAKEEEEAMLAKLENEGIWTVGTSEENTSTRKKAFRLEHLEERLPYLEIYPSPMKDTQTDSAGGPPTNYRAGRRPSWTFRQQHALLDVIVDTNEETEVEDADPANCPSDTDNSPLKVDVKDELLKAGNPIKPNMRSPCVRVNFRLPQAPSPQRGPDLRPEDVDQALTDFAPGSRELYNQNLPKENTDKPKTRYGIMSQILANQGAHFDVLLELVDWNETTSQRTWDLICRLPTNNELLRKMIHLRHIEKNQEAPGDVEWSELLDGSNIHRLLYALRLVEALLVPIKPSATGDRELNSGRRQWRERFVRLGGAKHLYETLLTWPEEHSLNNPSTGDSLSSQYAKNIRATCLAAVMRVLHYFFYWGNLITTEKTLQDKLLPFDVRLHSSTLPEFVKSIDLPSLLQVAVQLTQSFCSQKEASFSEEAAEAVYCGVQLCCSLIRFSPHLTIMVFEQYPDNENSFSNKKENGTTMSGWLKALLVDCPSKPTRAQVLDALSEMATVFGVMNSCSPARALFEPLVVSACYLVSDDHLGESLKYPALEELFMFCRVLLGCCGYVQTCKSTETDDRSNVNDTLAVALVRKQIPGRLVRNLCRIVAQRQAAVTTRNIHAPRYQDEGILGGYLQLLALLASISEKTRTAIVRYAMKNSSDQTSDASGDNTQMICFLHNDLLFGDKVGDHDIPNPLVCRTNSTRDLAQRLLLNLVFPRTLGTECGFNDLNGNMLVLLAHLRDYQLRVLTTVNLAGRQWNYAPADSLMDPSKNTHHAGLVNPGCICYMNSLIQQLFMMPKFCGGLLALDCSKIGADRSSSSWKEEIEQLQKLFVSLAYTNYRSSDPTAFAHSHKDMDGNSTDVHIQMDADEFFSLLLDRLEMFIRPIPRTDPDNTGEDSKSHHDDDFMAQSFGGVLVNQILTQQGNLSEREEKFFALSLEVSKKRHLAESLELYVQGEILEGENAYFCERVQRKVSATKRVCIKKLPQTLVCHLKRFEFDYDTMEKMKINDYLEFPMDIDMFPYTSEALAATNNAKASGKTEKSIMYDLVGVVVHSGTSDTGHYYSFIKDRHEVENQRWLEFNDEVVRDFDVETMGEECFGGEEVAQKWDALQGTYSPIVQMKRRSAYMLIYERRSTEDDFSLEPGVTSMAGTLTLSSQVQALATQIMQENSQQEGVVNAFDPTYEQFIRDLVESASRLSSDFDPAVARQACQLGCQFLFGINSLRCRTTASSHTSSPTVMSSPYSISACVALWLDGYDKSSSRDFDDERMQFSKWILAEVVAPPTTSLSTSLSTVVPHVESQRTWLFDTLFLSSGGQEFIDSCFQVLLAAISVLAREVVAKNVEAEESLVAFFREALNLFYSREPHLDLCDPSSGCVLTLAVESRVPAVKQLGIFFEKCISESTGANSKEKMSAELCTFRGLFLKKLQFLNHFLLTLQTPCGPSDVVKSSAASRGIAPLAIETRSRTPLREHDLRLCTFLLETKLLKQLLESYDQPTPPPLDTTLLLSHTALKNVVLFGLEDIVLPILIRIIFENEPSSSKCDRLVALLIGVLEEVKDSHAEKVLTVFGKLLNEEEERAKHKEESETSNLTWTVHQHVFSPTRGILESVTYYRDHGSHEYTLLLLEFVVHRASASPVLQELFKCDPKFFSTASWIPGWLVDHLDSNGTIRAQMRSNKEDSTNTDKVEGVEEVQKLFIQVEKAFGVTIPVYREDAAHSSNAEEHGVLISPAMSPSVIRAEDVLLEALDEENQHSVSSVKHGIGGIRRLGKSITSESGPEHEGAEADSQQAGQKLYRSREDLSMLLRIDLDTSHNNAREA